MYDKTSTLNAVISVYDFLINENLARSFSQESGRAKQSAANDQLAWSFELLCSLLTRLAVEAT